MTTLTAFLHPPVERISRWLHRGSAPRSDRPNPGPPRGPDVDPMPNPGHTPTHRHLASPPDVPGLHMSGPMQHQHHPAWMGTGGRVDRLRRNERHGDEKKD
jgi:hypothetical protein